MFHLPLCLSSPLINTTCPIAIPYAFGCFSYCVFLKENAGTLCSLYSGLRPYNVWYIAAASFLICHHHQIVFLVIVCPCIRMFGVNTGNWTSSLYISSRLFKFISVSSMTSCSSCFLSFAFPVPLYKHCFTSPTILSNCPPHYGAQLRLNFHFTCSVTKNSCIPSSL